jgi:tyrosyl-tRNA synthetase
MYKSGFLQEIHSRGFIYQSSDIDKLDVLMSKNVVTGYIGFDPTNDSLHVGSLVQLMLLHWMQHYGHLPIALMGGGTTLIGDPSGKDESRKIIQKEQVENNIKQIKSIFSKFINIDEKAKIINNYDWLSSINYIDFLRNIGKKMTVNRMLTFESVKSRLDRDQPLSFLEFNYMLLQAYDFLYLNENYDCVLQMGGSDQWGNIISGIDLIKKSNNKSAYAITSPLITNNSGSKMGKTAQGAIWLNKKKLPDFDFFQFWRNTNDNDVERFLKLFTTLNLEEINRLANLKNKEINEAKKILAYEVTKICRGKKSADDALEISKNIFDENLVDVRANSIAILSNNISNDNFDVIDALEKLKLVQSRSEAKRIVKSGGVRINNILISDDSYSLKSFINNLDTIKIVVGKKKIGFLKIKK